MGSFLRLTFSQSFCLHCTCVCRFPFWFGALLETASYRKTTVYLIPEASQHRIHHCQYEHLPFIVLPLNSYSSGAAHVFRVKAQYLADFYAWIWTTTKNHLATYLRLSNQVF